RLSVELRYLMVGEPIGLCESLQRANRALKLRVHDRGRCAGGLEYLALNRLSTAPNHALTEHRRREPRGGGCTDDQQNQVRAERQCGPGTTHRLCHRVQGITSAIPRDCPHQLSYGVAK